MNLVDGKRAAMNPITNRSIGLGRLGLLAGLAAIAACTAGAETEPSEHASTADAAERYIVGFHDAAAGRAEMRAAGAEKVLAIRGMNAAAYRLPARAVEALEQSPAIAFIEPDHRRYPLGDIVPYGIEMVQAHLVSDEHAANRKVCVIDSGYYIGHSDLQNNNVTGNSNAGSGDPFRDSCGHGTHVTGTISALANGEGVLGVLPSGHVGLHIVKVFGDDDFSSGACGYSHTSSVINAAQECAAAGAHVINMSLGGSGSSNAEAQAFQNLFDQGILLVAAAGNDGNTRHSFPASYDAVISVAAIDQNKALAGFSQRNNQVELAAPGVSVISTVPTQEAALTVDGQLYLVGFMTGSVRTAVSGPLASGGLCNSQDSGWSGRVVLCERGEISFGDKVANVTASGGLGAVIYNNEPGNFSGTLSNNQNFVSAIPAVSASQEDGQQLLASALGTQAQVSTELLAPASGYAAQQGTSMASPHVAAVAALVWSHDTSWTNQQIRNALAATAEDLGAPGRDDSFGHGLVQARAALDHLGGGGGGCLLSISDVETSALDADRFAITWTTADSASSEVSFSCCGTYSDGERKTAHRMVFRGSAEASYEFVLGGTSANGCTTEAGPFTHAN
jgi:serine protease